MEVPPCGLVRMLRLAFTRSARSFIPAGGEKPYQASIISGSLPIGVLLETDTVISPAGVVAYGTPTNPARYEFVIRWMDASEPHLVLDVPYSLTVTGTDLAVRYCSGAPGYSVKEQPVLL